MATALLPPDVLATPEMALRSSPAPRLGYKPALDGLRAIAVLVVMAHHAYLPFFAGGHIGVDIFFVLSGFLITSLLLDEWDIKSRISLKTFYIRRVLRLMPAVLGLLLVAQMFAILRLRGEYFWLVEKAIAGTFFYVANWMQVFNSASLGPIPHTWSLAVEEQFYIVWPPVLLLLLPRMSKAHIFLIIAATSLIVELHRFNLWTTEDSWQRIYHATDTRFDALLIGCGAALVFSCGWLKNRIVQSILPYASIVAAVTICRVVARPVSHQSFVFYGWTLIEISVATIVCWLVAARGSVAHRILEFPPLVWIGRISYGLYLWHVPLFSKLGSLPLPRVLQICIMFTVSIGVAWFSYGFIEKPFLRLKSSLADGGAARRLPETKLKPRQLLFSRQ